MSPTFSLRKPVLFCLSLALLTCNGPSVFAQINAYAKVAGISGTIFSVGNVNQTYHNFTVGEQIIIMQMQDTVIGANTVNNSSFGTISNIASAGRFEALTISSVSISGTSGTIMTTTAPAYTYDVSGSVQIISFQTLGANVTLSSTTTALPWDGSVGGVVAFQAGGTLTLAASVNADVKGFRGGATSSNYESGCEPTVYTSTYSVYAQKGEGAHYSSSLNYSTYTGRGLFVNGGGGGSDDNGGGGGGGNYTAGGLGGHGWSCTTETTASGGLGGLGLMSYIGGNRAFMGGGGGGGQQNNGYGTAGAAGGGIVIIKVNELKTSCDGSSYSITANGGSNGLNGGNDGAGGGGAGGSILLDVNTYSVSNSCPLTISANGGVGGSVNDPGEHGAGGGGGQGAIIFLSALPTDNITVTTTPGAGGKNSTSSGTTTTGDGAGSSNSGVVTGTPIILPVTFSSFTAVKSGSDALLTWKTSKTYQSVTFTIERSADGLSYTAIGDVNALIDASGSETYTFTDAAVLPGKNFYRIVETDLAGKQYYSNVAMVDWSSNTAVFHLYPNPSSGSFTLQLVSAGAGPAVVCIQDIAGAAVYQATIVLADSKVLVAPSQHLTPGVYMVRVSTATGTQTGKLLIR